MLKVLNRYVERLAMAGLVGMIVLGLPADMIIQAAECAAAGAGNCP